MNRDIDDMEESLNLIIITLLSIITELEQVIREYILDIYGKQYIGKIKILELNPVGYSIKLDIGCPEKPLVIYAELEDSKFLKFLKEELKIKRFNLINFG